MSNKERCLIRALGMLKDRSIYHYGEKGNMGRAYQSAAQILEAAIEENWEVLNQFDYYGKE